jgi:putative transposase
VAERFLSGLLKEHGRHHVSTAGENWYPHACRLLRIKHHLLCPYEKSIIERKMQYIKDRTECFIDFLLLAKEEMQIKAHNQLVKPFRRFSQQGIED